MRLRLALLLGLSSAIAAGIGAAAVSPRPTNDQLDVRMPGVRVSQAFAGAVPSLAMDIAIQKARDHWAWPATAAAQARLVMFSDDDYAPEAAALGPASTPFIQNRLVWLVTVENVKWQSQGRVKKDPNTEVHIVVDAQTGKVLELFSYR